MVKAVHYTKSGGPEVLRLVQLPKPVPRRGELLIAVRCASVTRGDVSMRTMPRLALHVVGAIAGFRPMEVPGVEYSGIVETVGDGVSGFHSGDEVCGTTTGLSRGANAEYVCVPARPRLGAIARKRPSVGFDQSAASIVGGMTALYLLRAAGYGTESGSMAGKRMLVYGASGSVGSFAVQLAVAFGAEVTAVCSAANLGLARSLGAARALDYAGDEFSRMTARGFGRTARVEPSELAGASPRRQSATSDPAHESTFDAVFDAVGKLARPARTVLLAPRGKSMSVRSMTKESSADLELLQDLLEQGRIRTHIDRTYTLEQVVEAHRYVETGHKRGNIVVTMAGDES